MFSKCLCGFCQGLSVSVYIPKTCICNVKKQHLLIMQNNHKRWWRLYVQHCQRRAEGIIRDMFLLNHSVYHLPRKSGVRAWNDITPSCRYSFVRKRFSCLLMLFSYLSAFIKRIYIASTVVPTYHIKNINFTEVAFQYRYGETCWVFGWSGMTKILVNKWNNNSIYIVLSRGQLSFKTNSGVVRILHPSKEEIQLRSIS